MNVYLHDGPNDGERHEVEFVGRRVLIPIGRSREQEAHDLVYEYERPGEYRFWGRHYGWRTPETADQY